MPRPCLRRGLLPYPWPDLRQSRHGGLPRAPRSGQLQNRPARSRMAHHPRSRPRPLHHRPSRPVRRPAHPRHRRQPQPPELPACRNRHQSRQQDRPQDRPRRLQGRPLHRRWSRRRLSPCEVRFHGGAVRPWRSRQASAARTPRHSSPERVRCAESWHRSTVPRAAESRHPRACQQGRSPGWRHQAPREAGPDVRYRMTSLKGSRDQTKSSPPRPARTIEPSSDIRRATLMIRFCAS